MKKPYTRDARPETIASELWFRGLIKIDGEVVYKATAIEKSAFIAANQAEREYLSNEERKAK